MGGIILVSSFLLQSLLAHAGGITWCTHTFLSYFRISRSVESLLEELDRTLRMLVPPWVNTCR